MDLRKLRHVSVLARAGSFVKAAEELHITQSALSRSVQALEAQLQMRIFDRGRAGVHVTAAGRLLIERADSLLFAAHGLQHDLGLASRGEFGAIGFGLGPLPASIFLTRLLTQIAREHRSLQVSVEINNAAVLVESLHAERIEFCICSSEPVPITEKTTMTTLCTLPIAFYVRAGHPLASRDTLTAREVFKFPFMSNNLSQQSRQSMKVMTGLHPEDTLSVAIGCDDYLALKSVVLNSDAVLMATHATVAAEIASGSIVPLAKMPFKKPASAQLKIMSLAGRTLSPAAQLLIGKIRTHALEQSEGYKANGATAGRTKKLPKEKRK